jgi:hypothetical protein
MQNIISNIHSKTKLTLISTIDSSRTNINLKKFVILSPVIKSMIESVDIPVLNEISLNFSKEELTDFAEYIKYYGFNDVFNTFPATQIKNIKKLIHYFELESLQAYTVMFKKDFDETSNTYNNEETYQYKGLDYIVRIVLDKQKIYFVMKFSNLYEYNLVQEFIKDFNIVCPRGEKVIFESQLRSFTKNKFLIY